MKTQDQLTANIRYSGDTGDITGEDIVDLNIIVNSLNQYESVERIVYGEEEISGDNVYNTILRSNPDRYIPIQVKMSDEVEIPEVGDWKAEENYEVEDGKDDGWHEVESEDAEVKTQDEEILESIKERLGS